MQQRPFRLGDTVDDYCPRERRITNHAVVAIVDDEVKQTRCSTCEAEHLYKEGKVPSRRGRKEEHGVLQKQLPEAMQNQSEELAGEIDRQATTESVVEIVQVQTASVDVQTIDPSGPEKQPALDEGPVHRPLIRATLPRHDGQPPARPVPEFTVRQASGRGGTFRNNDPRFMRQGDRQRGNGNRAPGHGSGQRFMASRPGGKQGRPGVERSSRFSPHSEHRTHPHARHERLGHPGRSGKKRSR